MTELVCPVCGKAPPGGGTMCPDCIVDLVPAAHLPPTSPVAADPAAPAGVGGTAPPPDGPGPASGPSEPGPANGPRPYVPSQCWNCDEPVPDTGNTCCAACGKPLAPPRLALRFAAGQVALCQDQRATLGRDSEESPHAHLSPNENVSRLHATVGVDGDGNAWIRDEWSTNGTFVNGREISQRPPTPIVDGDRIRLGADVNAEVHVYPVPR